MCQRHIKSSVIYSLNTISLNFYGVMFSLSVGNRSVSLHEIFSSIVALVHQNYVRGTNLHTAIDFIFGR